MPIPTTTLVPMCWVSGVDVIVALELTLVNVSSIRTRLIFKAGIPSHVVRGRAVVILLVAITAGVLRDQVGHTARISVDLHFAVEPVVMGWRVQHAVGRSG